MGKFGRRITTGAAALSLAASFAAASSASASTGAVPQAGNWEGVGPHGLPLSFSLVRSGDRLVADSIALGAPWTCPANERDAEAVPLSRTTYTGPGDGSGQSAGGAVLSGRIPGHNKTAAIRGQFETPTSGTFSIPDATALNCGWPKHELTWRVHRARRVRIADGKWKASLTAPDITTGSFTLFIAGHGRVIRALRTAFRCQTTTASGTGGFTAWPAYEFIRPNGSFYSPLTGNTIQHHRVTWQGWLSSSGAFFGTLRIFDPCTQRVIRAHFQR